MDTPEDQATRQQMVKKQLQTRGIVDEAVLRAMGSVPRHLFVPEKRRKLAYEDRPLGIGKFQTISQPYIVALMTQLLRLDPMARVLEIGTGSGYQAAVLAEIVSEVYTIERHEALAESAAASLRILGHRHVHVRHGDGSHGWLEHAPFDGIVVTAAAPRVPPPLLAQLVDGGRLVIPVGDAHGQYLQCWRRQGERTDYDTIVPVSFVPMRGDLGWGEADWKPPG